MDIRLDEGFLFGMGVFETVAVEQGRPLLLEQHLNRGNVGEDAWST